MNERKFSLLRKDEGSSFLIMIMVTAALMFTIQMVMIARQMEIWKLGRDSSAQESRFQILAFLDSTLGQEMTLRNSRFSINSELKRCLTGTPSPCDERESYDMILASPTPPLVFQGGTWPDIPADVPWLAGGLLTNKLFYTPTGGRCPIQNITDVNETCPLQAIIQFKPLCGGTKEVPDISTPGGGVCTGPATGFDITIGVGKLLGTQLVYRQRTAMGGDAKTYRFTAMILRN